MSSVVTHLVADDAQVQEACKRAEKSLADYGAKAGATMKKIATGIVAGWGGIAAGGLLASKEDTEAQKKLEAVIRSTGGAAGFTGQQLRQYATDLQGVTRYSNQATVSAMAVMATFTNIKGDVFKDAIKAAQDMSEIMGQDLQSSVVQLGKALNDPIQGVTALQRVGVAFTEQQKTQIQTLVNSGRVVEAQKVVLKELAVEFGGAAEAMYSPMTALKNRMQDLAATIGEVLKPRLKEWAQFVGSAISWLENLSDSQKRNLVLMAEWAAAIAAGVLIIPKLIAALSGIATAVAGVVKGMIWLNAMMGPKGWAMIAAGAVAAGTTLYALNQSLGEVGKTAETVETKTVKAFSNIEAAAKRAQTATIMKEITERQNKEADESAQAYYKFMRENLDSPTKKAVDALADNPITMQHGLDARQRQALANFRKKTLDDAFGNVDTPIQKYLQTMRNLDEAMEAGIMSQDRYAASVQAAKDAFIGANVLDAYEQYAATIKKLKEALDAGALSQDQFHKRRAEALKTAKSATGEQSLFDETRTNAEKLEARLQELDDMRNRKDGLAISAELHQKGVAKALKDFGPSGAESDAGRFEDLTGLYKRISSAAGSSPQERAANAAEENVKLQGELIALSKEQNDTLQKLVGKPVVKLNQGFQ